MELNVAPCPRLDCPAPSETAERFVAAMAGAATGVTVVTTDGPAGRRGVTVSAVASASAEPPLVLACVNRKSPVAAAIDRNGAFCVNLLAADQQHVSDTFAGRPRKGEPFDFRCGAWLAGATGAPVLADGLAAFDCLLEQAYDAGSHRIFIGRVIEARRGKADPLIYVRRGYRRIADLVN